MIAILMGYMHMVIDRGSYRSDTPIESICKKEATGFWEKLGSLTFLQFVLKLDNLSESSSYLHVANTYTHKSQASKVWLGFIYSGFFL